MTLNEYQECVARTMPRGAYPSWVSDGQAFDQLIFTLGLAGEAGEVADLVKKGHGHGHPIDRNKVKEELGDAAWYLGAVAKRFGLTLEDVCKANVEKLQKRYPNGFSSEASQARVDVEDAAQAVEALATEKRPQHSMRREEPCAACKSDGCAHWWRSLL